MQVHDLGQSLSLHQKLCEEARPKSGSSVGGGGRLGGGDKAHKRERVCNPLWGLQGDSKFVK